MQIATELLEAEHELQQAQRDHDGSAEARARYTRAVARARQAERTAVIELDRRSAEDEKLALCRQAEPRGADRFGSR